MNLDKEISWLVEHHWSQPLPFASQVRQVHRLHRRPSLRPGLARNQRRAILRNRYVKVRCQKCVNFELGSWEDYDKPAWLCNLNYSGPKHCKSFETRQFD